MTTLDHAGSMGESRAFAALSAHIERAAGSTDSLTTILWMVGAHPQLLAHARVLSNLEELLQTDTFLHGSLYWSSAWREELSDGKGTLTQIRELGPALRKDLELESMYRANKPEGAAFAAVRSTAKCHRARPPQQAIAPAAPSPAAGDWRHGFQGLQLAPFSSQLDAVGTRGEGKRCVEGSLGGSPANWAQTTMLSA